MAALDPRSSGGPFRVPGDPGLPDSTGFRCAAAAAGVRGGWAPAVLGLCVGVLAAWLAAGVFDKLGLLMVPVVIAIAALGRLRRRR